MARLRVNVHIDGSAADVRKAEKALDGAAKDAGLVPGATERRESPITDSVSVRREYVPAGEAGQ